MSTEKTIIDKIKALFVEPEVKLATETLDEGAATLEAEAFEADQPVFIVNEDERIPLPVGEYQLDNGMILVVLDKGIIAEMKEKASEEPGEAEEVAAGDKPSETPLPKKIVESVSKESHFSVEDKKKLEERVQELEVALSTKIEDKEKELKFLKDQELKSLTDKVVETIELEKKEEVKHIVPNPEKEPVKLHKFAKGAKKNINSSVMSRIANL